MVRSKATIKPGPRFPTRLQNETYETLTLFKAEKSFVRSRGYLGSVSPVTVLSPNAHFDFDVRTTDEFILCNDSATGNPRLFSSTFGDAFIFELSDFWGQAKRHDGRTCVPLVMKDIRLQDSCFSTVIPLLPWLRPEADGSAFEDAKFRMHLLRDPSATDLPPGLMQELAAYQKEKIRLDSEYEIARRLLRQYYDLKREVDIEPEGVVRAKSIA